MSTIGVADSSTTRSYSVAHVLHHSWRLLHQPVVSRGSGRLFAGGMSRLFAVRVPLVGLEGLPVMFGWRMRRPIDGAVAGGVCAARPVLKVTLNSNLTMLGSAPSLDAPARGGC